MFEPKVRNEQTDLLMEAVLNITSAEDAYRFFEDVCGAQKHGPAN